ncbi:MAG: 30S ribosomal protein S12 methylthiotransferase RimO [Clostridiales bacterium]|nr:30S ribosomal protein S12 methylthiotransferase RimO [Clostridiales bacterium]
MNIYLYSLGCVKNLVDGEAMSGLLRESGFELTDDASAAEVIIVNTCGFIRSAKEESIAAILRLAEYKKNGRCRLLLAAGCMPQKYAAEMLSSMPEIDAALGPGQISEAAPLIREKLGLGERSPVSCRDVNLLRRLSTPFYMAYLKIADGCDNRCSYCLIPQLRGAYKSRPVPDILAEARLLAQKGVKELVLVAQDTTGYGIDLYGEVRLPELLRELAALPFVWIRLMYSYPRRIGPELLRVMAEHENICHYLDLPLQHADDGVLAAMNRPDTRRSLLEKIALIREYLPDAALRTTVMVGFPGETPAAWQNLLGFLREARFDWVGVFAFSKEDDTAAALLPGQVAEKTKKSRLHKTMSLLADLSAEKMRGFISRELEVLVEGRGEDGLYFGRSAFHAPEVDGLVYFSGGEWEEIGSFVKVRVTDADVYDLYGVKV